MFQFTQPKRAATPRQTESCRQHACFNSRSPSGLRPQLNQFTLVFDEVSIHAAQAGCDHLLARLWQISPVSIHAAQAGCDRGGQIYRSRVLVSIHAAQAGCDAFLDQIQKQQIVSIHAAQAGCDKTAGGLRRVYTVSIHAAQAGCDKVSFQTLFTIVLFQFTQPKRAATFIRYGQRAQVVFQFTQPKRAATGGFVRRELSQRVSIHAAQAGCDKSVNAFNLFDYVSIHAAQAGCDGCCKDTTKKRFSQRINRESPY